MHQSSSSKLSGEKARRKRDIIRSALHAAVRTGQIETLKALLGTTMLVPSNSRGLMAGIPVKQFVYDKSYFMQDLLCEPCGKEGPPLAVALCFNQERAARHLLAAGAPHDDATIAQMLSHAMAHCQEERTVDALALAKKLGLARMQPLARRASRRRRASARWSSRRRCCTSRPATTAPTSCKPCWRTCRRRSATLRCRLRMSAAPLRCTWPPCSWPAGVHPTRSTGPILTEVLRKWGQIGENDRCYINDMVELLVKHGADPLAKDAHGEHALSVAIRLARFNDNYDNRLDEDATFLKSLLVGMGLLDCAELNEVQLDKLRAAGREPLRQAIQGKAFEAIELLLEAGLPSTAAEVALAEELKLGNSMCAILGMACLRDVAE